MPKKKEEAETREEIIQDIEKSGVPEKIAEKEEKLDEKALEKKKKALLKKAKELKEKLEKPETEELKETLRLQWMRLIGQSPGKVKRVACCSGSGAGLFPELLGHRLQGPLGFQTHSWCPYVLPHRNHRILQG